MIKTEKAQGGAKQTMITMKGIKLKAVINLFKWDVIFFLIIR